MRVLIKYSVLFYVVWFLHANPAYLGLLFPAFVLVFTVWALHKASRFYKYWSVYFRYWL